MARIIDFRDAQAVLFDFGAHVIQCDISFLLPHAFYFLRKGFGLSSELFVVVHRLSDFWHVDRRAAPSVGQSGQAAKIILRIMKTPSNRYFQKMLARYIFLSER
ncbi:hypothetical protein WS48_17470 [Burkholderia sp. RF7-non_BP1]|nr:hypothetical protein WS45_28220 [Burkholderia sp. RF2-non_BP3]KUY82008.1 hypothetical protein WS46_15815 [Burkholderia sp. RF4-BP95]KUY95618.1 hypothetical protein WS48_17470 [Burkholderia sp. RF7-non_BP1]KUY98921.1 hypothetical protein WS49_18965 [Burkholderia sp. RF7-non_BP4]